MESNEVQENPNKYYSADLSISIVEIKARSKEQAEYIIREFVNKISPLMENEVKWDEAVWTVEENVLNEKDGVWVVTK